MANDYEVKVGIEVDESELSKIESSLENLKKQGKSIKFNTDDSAFIKDINNIISQAKKMFKGLEFKPVFNTSDAKKSLSQLSQLITQVKKSMDLGFDPNSVLGKSKNTITSVTHNMRSELKELEKIRNSLKTLGIDDSQFSKLTNGLSDATKYISQAKTAAENFGQQLGLSADMSGAKVIDLAEDIMKLNQAYNVVEGGAETFHKVLNESQKATIYKSIQDSLKSVGQQLDISQADWDKYIRNIVTKFDNAGRLISATVKSSVNGITLSTNFNTQDMYGKDALLQADTTINDKSREYALQALTKYYSGLIALEKEYSNAVKQGNTETANAIQDEINKRKQQEQSLRDAVTNQTELTRVTKEYQTQIDKLNAKDIDFMNKTQDDSRLKNISTTLSQLEKYQQKINTLQNTGSFNSNAIQEYQNKISQLIQDISQLGITYDATTNKFNTENLNTSNIMITEQALERLIQTLNKFKGDINLTQASQMDFVDRQAIQTAINLLEELEKKKIEVAKAKMQGSDETYIRKLNSEITELENKLTQAKNAQLNFGSTVSQTTQYLNAEASSAQKTKSAIEQIENGAKKSTQSIKDLSSGFDTLLSNAGRLAASYIIFDQLQNAIYSSVQEVRELNTAMTDLQIVTEQSDTAIENMMAKYATMAKDLGTTLDAVAEGSAEWLRQGFSSAQTDQLLKSSTMLATIGKMDASTATENLTAILNGFNMEAEQSMMVVDTLNELD